MPTLYFRKTDKLINIINCKIDEENLGDGMTEEAIVQFTFTVDDPELDDDKRQKDAKKLLRELRDLDEVEKVDRTEDLNPEEGSKPGFATLIGVLTAEVSIKNIKYFLGFLVDRLGDKPIKVNIKVGTQGVFHKAGN